MTNSTERLWWPVAVTPSERRSEEVQAKIEFLERATEQGCRAYLEQSDCGAIATDGRAVAIIWRGKQRAELCLIHPGIDMAKKMFEELTPVAAFRQASREALEWLSGPLVADSD